MPEEFSHFAIFTGFGEGLAIALRLKEEGNEVLVGMVDDVKDIMQKEEEDAESKAIRWSAFDGLLDKRPAQELLESMAEIDEKDEWCVIFDFNTLFKYADQARALGFKYGLFPIRLDYTLEADRDLAKRFVQKHYPDLRVADVQEFKTVEEGMEFLQDSNEFWALKGNDTGAKTVVPSAVVHEHATAEIEDALMSDRDTYQRKGFIFERQIRDGLEVCPQMIWMDGKRVASCIDLEDKRLSPNNGASMEGCAINMIVETPLDCELNRMAFPPATDALARKHKGLFYLDANLIIKDGEAYYLEFCSNRMGYDAVFAEIYMAGGASAYFNALLHSQSPYQSKHGVGVRGFATKRDDEGDIKDGLRIQFNDPDHLWHFAIRKDGNKMLNTKGAFGDAIHGTDLVAFTESSDDSAYALQKLQDVVDSYSFPGLLVRRDISTLLSRLDGLTKYLTAADGQ